MSNPIRPICRYHGGKAKQARQIIAFFPKHLIYCESFCGVASVLLQKEPAEREVINYLDENIFNLFKIMQDHRLDELIHIIDNTAYSRQSFKLAQAARDLPIQPGDEIRQVANFIICNQMGFSTTPQSSFRCDTKRPYTISAHDWVSAGDVIKSFVERLKGVVVENRDAILVMQAADSPETVHYVDSPYVPLTRGGSSKYKHDYTVEDHEKLLAAVLNLKGMVIISGYPTELYKKVLEQDNGWQRIDKLAFADGNQPRTECLWLNPLCQKNQQQTDLFSFNPLKDSAHA